MWKKVTVMVFSILFLLSMFPLHRAIGQPTATLSVTNAFGLSVGDIFSININVSDVTNLAAWQFTLYYQSAVLNGIGVTEGPFLGSTGAQRFFSTVNFTDSYNATHGAVTAFALIISPPDAGVSGSGILASVTFRAVGSGPSVLSFDLTGVYKTKLVDSSPGAGNLIPFTPVNGMAYVGMVDVAIGGIDVPPSIPIASIAIINVTAQNRGQPPETFDVTLSYNGNPIDGAKTVLNLPGGGSQILSFAWDTTLVPMGQYTLTASATIVVGDIDTSDNTFSVNVYVGTVDIAITGVNAKTSIPAGLNGTEVDVTITNSGQAAETLNITLSVDSDSVDNKTTTLNPGASATVALWWNTTTLSFGTYTVKAFITPLPFQIDTTNNNFTTTATVTIPGDLNSDFTVGLSDLVILAHAYGSRLGDSAWKANADIDGNRLVGLTDLVILATHYGQHFP
jgi:hypothetical protein